MRVDVPQPRSRTTRRTPPTGRATTRRGRSAPIPSAVCLATTELLAEQPLEKLTVSEILTRSGVSRTSFYYHFTSKEAVVAALLEQIADELDEQVATLPRRPLGTHETIKAALAAAFRIWDEHRTVLLVAQTAARAESRLGDIWRSLVEDRYVRPFAEHVRVAQAAGRLAPGSDPLTLSRTLHWMSEHALYAHVSGAAHAPAADAVEALAHVWAASLGGPAAAARPAR